VPDPPTSHVFYTEAYEEPRHVDITLDARYMANVDIGLLRTTLLDPVSTGSAGGYRVLADAVTLRLCPWDPARAHHVSLIGPVVEPRGDHTTEDGARIPGMPASSVPGRPDPRQLGSSALSREIHDAVAQLVQKGPLLRGRVGLRFEFGRIILVGMDRTGLAFNAPGSPSQGWKKSELLRNLRRADRAQSHLFTPLLTQDRSDVDFLAHVDHGGVRMWEDEATETQTYSFSCRDRREGRDESFFVDVETSGRDDFSVRYLLRSEHDDKAPVCIHGVLRNWDARVVLSHADTHTLQDKYGAFAKRIAGAIPRAGGMPGFRVAIPDLDILWMRVRTLWRRASAGTGIDATSYLDITEVRPVEHKVLPCAGECVAHEFQPSSRRSRGPGELGPWYEASVASHAAEALLGQNETLDLGGKGRWDAERLLEEGGAIDALCTPGLRMLSRMDSVGAGNDNGRVDALVLPPGNLAGDKAPIVSSAAALDSARRPACPPSDQHFW
jgi:hypothetical protein